jgi:hypothetical protein
MRIPASGFVQIRLKVQKAPGKARTHCIRKVEYGSYLKLAFILNPPMVLSR